MKINDINILKKRIKMHNIHLKEKDVKYQSLKVEVTKLNKLFDEHDKSTKLRIHELK